MKRILFVDDDANILMGLRRSLRGFRNEWEMVFAEGGAAALGYCAMLCRSMPWSRMSGCRGWKAPCSWARSCDSAPTPFV